MLYWVLKTDFEITMKIKILLLILLSIGFTSAQPSGLEVSPGTGMYFLVENMPDEAIEIGLTRELIEIKIEKLLRKNRIQISSSNNVNFNKIYLYININMIGNSFKIDIDFKRQVDYYVDEEIYSVFAVTYSVGGSGTHSGNKSFIVETLEEYLGIFILEYIRVNEISSHKVNTPKKPVTIDDYMYIGIGGGHWISKKSVNGIMITLEDGSLWEVHSIDKIYTMLWLPVSNITVLESKSPIGEYRYELYNIDDGEKALVKYLGNQN
ncbi:MAG: hypothetical protein HOG71_13835 [Bacteroidetes bacterium]|nr:hypothetical protein [Bacteroidota bacterium]